MNLRTVKTSLIAVAVLALTATSILAVPVAPLTVKFFGQATIALGGSTTMDITVNNTGSTDYNSVTFSDTLPAGLVVSTPNGLLSACTPGSTLGAITAVAGTHAVAIGASKILAGGACTVQTNVTGAAPGPVTNSVAASDPSTGAGAPGIAMITVLPGTPPVILKFFGQSTIGVGGSTTMDITVNNTGSADYNSVTFSDTLSAGLVVSTPNGLLSACTAGSTLGAITAVAGSHTVSLGASKILAGGACTVQTNVTGAAPGPVTNSVAASDPSTGAGAPGTAMITVLAGSPPSIGKAFGAPSILVNASTSLTFTINAAQAMTNVFFTDSLPSGLVVATPNGLGGTCNGVATATAGSSTISLTGATFAMAGMCTVIVNVTGISAGAQVNVVQAGDVAFGSGNTAMATLTVNASADLSITKSGAGTVNAGQNIVYTIVAKNNGPSTATSVVVADPTPPGTTFVSNSGACATAFPCSLGTLTSGQSATITATYKVSAGAASGSTITNTATVSSAVGDPNPGNNSQSSSATVSTSADLSITKTGPTLVNSPVDVPYTITVSNAGPSNSSGVTVTDVIPLNTSFVSATPSQGSCSGSATVTCSLGTLNVGSSAMIALVVHANSGNNVSNTATVAAATSDPNVANNTATTATAGPVTPAPSSLILLVTGMLGLLGWAAWRSRMRRSIRQACRQQGNDQ